jgi:hypothetical protein
MSSAKSLGVTLVYFRVDSRVLGARVPPAWNRHGDDAGTEIATKLTDDTKGRPYVLGLIGDSCGENRRGPVL